MAENDAHYNDTNMDPGMNAGMNADMGNNMDQNTSMDAEGGMAAGYSSTDNDYGLTTPVAPPAGRPVPDNPAGTPQIPLPPTGSTPSLPEITPPSTPEVLPLYYGQVRFLNASTNTFPVTITIDGSPYAINSRFGTITNYDWISDGFHVVSVQQATGLRTILLQQTFSFVADQKVTMVLTDSASGGLELVRVVDSACVNLPVNSGCYRFANMSYSGSSFDLLMTGGDTIFRNVRFQNVTTYKQAIASTYQFSVVNSGSFTFVRELPIIMIGAVIGGISSGRPLINFTVDIQAGRSYTTYLIGNTWSSNSLRVITVED